MLKIQELPQKPMLVLPFGAKSRALKEKYDQLQEQYDEIQKLIGSINRVKQSLKLEKPEDHKKRQKDEDDDIFSICPYCLEKIKVKRLAFLADCSTDFENIPFGFPKEEDEKYGEYWKKRGLDNVDPLRGHILEMDPFKGEIASLIFETNHVGGRETVPFDDRAVDRMNRDRVVAVIDKYERISKDRICPNCHTILPNNFGFCPNYIFSLMGNTSCGKTVYIFRLILSIAKNARLLNGVFGKIVNSEVLFELNRKLFQSGTGEATKNLVPTAEECFSFTGFSMSNSTDVGYIPPIIFQLKDAKTNVQYMITLFDYPGEAIYQDDDTPYSAVADDIRLNSDGIIFTFDSGVTLSKKGILPEEYMQNYDMNNPLDVAEIGLVLTQIDKKLHHEPLTKPVAMVLTKTDYIKGCGDTINEKVWGHRDTPAFLRPADMKSRSRAENGYKLNIMDLYNCHKEVQSFINTYEVGADTQASDLTHGDMAWFGISSTGYAIEDGKIPENAPIIGIRECDPLEWLLYRNGQIEAEFDKNNQAVVDWLRSVQPQADNALRELKTKLGYKGIDSAEPDSMYDKYLKLRNEYTNIL